jgi:flagellin-like protein
MKKKMWKMRKDKSAVSPVIATILMVAITVVLAAVLYVMVMGFGGSTASTPTGSFTNVTTTTNGTGARQVNFGAISTTTSYSNCKISILDNTAGTAVSVTTNAMAPLSAGSTVIRLGAFGGASYTLSSTAATNLASNGNINVGDYITLPVGATAAAGVIVGHSYTIALIYVPTGGSICSLTFTA